MTRQQSDLLQLFRSELTRRQLDILQLMRDEDEELVYSRGIAYVGFERISTRTLSALLRAVAIKADQFNSKEFERYTINETGREILTNAGRTGRSPNETL